VEAVRLLKEALTQREEAQSWGWFQDRFSALSDNVSRVVVTSNRPLRFALLGLFGQGHILLEDLPGVGKTLLAKTIARSISGRFTRIQFTPDLLPTDITGTSIFDMRSSQFGFVPGPIFANIVLADELNRTGPRTQSALLESMGEHQVTVDGAPRALPRPFMVIATQNLAESYGTFHLPNSQMDRFLVSASIGLPTPDQEMEILRRSERGSIEVEPVLSPDEVVDMQEIVRQVRVAAPVKEYIVRLVGATRQLPSVAVGVSPRGAVALLRASQTWAAFEGRSFVVPEDVKEVAPEVLAHRLIQEGANSLAPKELVRDLLDSVPVPV
jgi:MoxR-like ATPase